jgi:GntR family transcriptional regulator / MocR family aminotransferase
MGTDFRQLDRSAAAAGRLSDWLTTQLRSAIADGRLSAGSTMPATRVLAHELGVSRGVVTEAYRRLAEEGQVMGHGRAGTRVVAVPAELMGDPASQPGRWPASRTSPGEAPHPAVFDALRAAPCRVDLSPGVPDLAAFPRSAWLRTERAVLANLAPASFGYSDPRGAPAFRASVASMLARNRGIRVSPDDVIITAGVAQGLALLARSLRQAGVGAVAVEDPGSLGARQQLQSWGLQTPPVGVDDLGLCVGELRATGASAVMVTPAHQFPMGVVLDGSRRRELQEWALDGGLVIEDDYDAEHRYDRPPVPAMRSALPDHVCYAGSVSKLLAPALRVGWLVVPPALQVSVIGAKRDADLGNAILPQLVLAELVASGQLDRHHRFLRKRHIRRRDAMIAAVGTHLPHVRVHGAAAGLHLTLTFDSVRRGLSDSDIAAAALEHGVKMHPLSWHSQRPAPPGLVLGYAASTPAQIDDGIAVVARVLGKPRRG